MPDEKITLTINSPAEYGLYALAYERPDLFKEAEEFKGAMLAERTSLAERVKALLELGMTTCDCCLAKLPPSAAASWRDGTTLCAHCVADMSGAEVERLRAALERIATSDRNTGMGRWAMIEIALQALSQPAADESERKNQ
jgi:hypothetical protein